MHYKLVSHREAAAKLKVARLQKGWTGVQAGEAAGMPQSQVSRIENGHQRVFTIGLRAKVQTLADALGVTDLRWEEASDAERVEDLSEGAAAEVRADEQQNRRERIRDYFMNTSRRDYHRTILLVMDLAGEGVLTSDDALKVVESVTLNENTRVTTVGQLDHA